MPPLPYIITITVYDSSNVVASGVTVTALNETKGESIVSDASDSNGQILMDLANLPSGVDTGDYVSFTASGSGDVGKVLKFKAVSYQDYVQIEDLSVGYEV